MPRYLISFNDGDMNSPEQDLADVAMAARAVVQAAQDAVVFVFARDLGDPGLASVVAADGAVTAGPKATTRDFIGGFTVVEVPNRQTAFGWAARIAIVCRCAQEVREFLSAPAR